MNATILVADDDRRVRGFLEHLLRREGLEVVTAHDGETALCLFNDVQPDLVLLDVVMPEPNGFEVCRRLKSDPKTALTPVVMLTGLGTIDDRVRGIEAGTDEFLSKPFDCVELIAMVRSLLRVKRLTDDLEQAESVVLTLARTIEARDPYTHGHCQRVSSYGSLLGERIGLSDEEVTALWRAGFVHDIGKVVVSDAILMKKNPLTSEEKAIIHQHPIAGEYICKNLKSFKLVLPIIRHHHERLDGSGYPDGLKGEQIPITARVLQIVDIYDALTTIRPYKLALSRHEALQTMQGEVERQWWDPKVFAEFRRMDHMRDKEGSSSSTGG